MTQSNAPQDLPYVLLVAIDYSELSTLALTEAIRQAMAHEHSQIHLVHALPPTQQPTHGRGAPDLAASYAAPPSGAGFSANIASDMQAYVEKALESLGGSAGRTNRAIPSAWTMHFRLTDPATAIVQLAADLQADLVIVGTHSRDWLSRFLLGSVAEAVVQRAPCPVLVVRPLGATARADAPAIEPPCPDCLQARRASAGREFWCERHRAHHERAHTYHFTPFKSSHQSGLLLHPLK